MDYFIHESCYIDENVVIGENTKIWHFTHIQSGARIGLSCTIGQNVNISNNVIIGNGVKIQNNVSVYEGVELEDYVFCGPSMVFTNDIFPRSIYPKDKQKYSKTLVKLGATIGANATIKCGIIIGKWALIGAGSVITKDVPNYALMIGNPAKQVGFICECGTKLKIGNIINQCEEEKFDYNTTICVHNNESSLLVSKGYLVTCLHCHKEYYIIDNAVEH